MMNCADFEVLLADSLDGALDAAGREAERNAFAQHRDSCQTCAEMEKEVRSAMSFMEMAAEPEFPQPLVGKILHATNSGWELKVRSKGIRGWINRALAPVLRPRLVMGAMLTVMSLTMLTRCAGGAEEYFDRRRSGSGAVVVVTRNPYGAGLGSGRQGLREYAGRI